jgi:hypothetical protein
VRVVKSASYLQIKKYFIVISIRKVPPVIFWIFFFEISKKPSTTNNLMEFNLRFGLELITGVHREAASAATEAVAFWSVFSAVAYIAGKFKFEVRIFKN